MTTYPVQALEVALLVLSVPLLWKSASLRGDQNTKWVARVELAYAGLSEQALSCLREIRSRTDELIGDPLAAFQPDLALADPAPLRNLTRTFESLLTARQSVRGRFARMLWICQFCPFVVFLFSIAMIVILLASFSVLTAVWVDEVALGAASLMGALGVVIVLAYIYLNWHLSQAESLARPL